MRKNLFIILMLLSCSVGFSQETTTKHNNIQTDFFIGRPIEHDKKLKDAIDGNSYGVLVSWNSIKPENSKFNNLFNYPERGYSFLYQNFNSDVLGESYGLYRHFTYNLTPKRKNHLKLTSAFGLGYITKPYDEVTNNLNHAIGSKLLASAYLKFQYFQFFKNNRLSMNTALNLIHFSNMSYKNPNLGINTVNFNIGLNYKLDPVEVTRNTSPDNLGELATKIQYNLVLRGGYNQSLIVGSDLYPFYTITAYGSKTLNHYSTVTAGLDFFNSEFLKDHIVYVNNDEGTNYDPEKYRRAGIFVGHELTQNNFAFISQIGYKFYSPYSYISRVYERFGFKYKLSNHWFSEVTLKVNLFRAEAMEFGIGYKF